jgi:hypothetical protein
MHINAWLLLVSDFQYLFINILFRMSSLSKLMYHEHTYWKSHKTSMEQILGCYCNFFLIKLAQFLDCCLYFIRKYMVTVQFMCIHWSVPFPLITCALMGGFSQNLVWTSCHKRPSYPSIRELCKESVCNFKCTALE